MHGLWVYGSKAVAAVIGPILLLAAAACSTGGAPVSDRSAARNGDAWVTREVAVSVQTPDPGWEIAIEEIHVVGDELWVLSKLNRDPEIMAPQVISEAEDRVEVEAPDYPVRHYVSGKTWQWEPDGPGAEVVFIEDRGEIEGELEKAIRIFERAQGTGS